MAMAEGKPPLTYMGAAAINCTERLKKIVNRIVGALEKKP